LGPNFPHRNFVHAIDSTVATIERKEITTIFTVRFAPRSLKFAEPKEGFSVEKGDICDLRRDGRLWRWIGREAGLRRRWWREGETRRRDGCILAEVSVGWW